LTEGTYPALSSLIQEISKQIKEYDKISEIPFAAVGNTRNDIYLVSEAIRFLEKDKNSNLTNSDKKILRDYKSAIDKATKFIPTWVKIAVAIALGLGTMIGWKRIVVTVGEKIGKEHLTYGQGASAELVAMSTIAAADMYGMPVSTTHILSSGVAGTMAANGSGVQMSTIRSLLMAWILTLPCAIILSGSLYFILNHALAMFSK
jgi:PiT family inorganic phosphate transporter